MKKQILFLAALFLGCITGVAQTATDSLALVMADWQVTVLDEGLTARKATFASLYGVPQEVSIFEIQPKRYRLNVQEHNGMEPTGAVSARSGAVAAINGTFYNMKKGYSECYLQLDGAVIDTTALGPTQSNGAVWLKKGRVEIMPWNKEVELKTMRKPGHASVMAAGPLMLQDGKACSLEGLHRSFVENRHPRSAIAVTKDKRILLIVVDGRKKGKCEGVSIAQFTHLARVLGAVDALNLDGGGSSTLWSSSLPDDGILNTPSDKSGERHVANSIGVYKK